MKKDLGTKSMMMGPDNYFTWLIKLRFLNISLKEFVNKHNKKQNYMIYMMHSILKSKHRNQLINHYISHIYV
jgi:hypothetical protein